MRAYTRKDLHNACAVFRTDGKAAICVRFCKKLYKREKDFSLFDTPYKMIFAIGTVSSVILYSTESEIPLAVVGNFHYATLNDLAWQKDNVLAVCSSDGFCSFLLFNKGELGQEVPKEGKSDLLLPPLPMRCLPPSLSTRLFGGAGPRARYQSRTPDIRI